MMTAGAAGFVLNTWTTERGVHELAMRDARADATGLVRRYAGYREVAGHLSRREVAGAGCSLILAWGDELEVRYEGASPIRLGAFVLGNHTRPTTTVFAGLQHGVQVDLTPQGAMALLGQSLRELTDQVIPVGDVLGRPAVELVERLEASASWPDRFAILDDVVGARRSQATVDPAVLWLWQQLNASMGATRVDELIAETGWSRRHLTRKFEQQVGLSPKTIARLSRFRRALAVMTATGPRVRLADVAAQAGYYDQAHFNREFKEFAGCTPSRYLAESDGDPEVQFVQDGDDALSVPSPA